MDESLLLKCNETELLWMVRNQGLGHLKVGLPKELLIDIILGKIDPGPEHFSGTSYSRKKLELFIEKHWAQCQSQLPGCNGKCTTFPCSEVRHLSCMESNREVVQ